MTSLRSAALAATLAACTPRVASVRPTAASPDETELLVYLQPLAPEAARLAFGIEAIVAVTADGVPVPLELARDAVSGRDPAAQRLLARGRLPPGSYAGLEVRARDATLAGDAGPAALLVAPEPARVAAPFLAAAGRPTVLWLALDYEASVREGGVGFAPSFAGAIPPRPPLQRIGYCASPALDRLTVLDARARLVVGAIATGRGPRGVALHERSARAYVALSGEDAIQAIDVQTGESRARIRLGPGDAPRDVAVTPDGRTLVTANAGSGTASLVDPSAEAEVARVRTGDEPSSVVLDRGGRRAYVVNRRSATVSVIDVGNRTVVGTVPTEAEPVRARLDRAGTRLYVVHAGSPFMTVVSVPDLAVRGRVFVGFGATSLQVDARTDLVYVGLEGEPRLLVVDPSALAQVDAIPLPGAPGATAIDDAENLLVAILPREGRAALVDLTSKRVVAVLDVGHDPSAFAAVRERL